MAETRPIRIAIDGPASSGKGTIARLVAEELGYTYVDTGALYRAVALVAQQQGVAWSDPDATATIAQRLELRWEVGPDGAHVYVDHQDVTLVIRGEQIGRGASMVAAHPGVRSALLDLQRRLGAGGGVIMDGRDIGTVVLPNAELKIYLDASIEERAHRRHRDQPERTYESIFADLAERDARDSGRSVAPLQAAPDAVRLDTTGLTIQAVVARVAALARSRMGLDETSPKT